MTRTPDRARFENIPEREDIAVAAIRSATTMLLS
jgi:hypothetical protein